MSFRSYLYADKVDINDRIYIRIPSVGEVMSDEEGYYALVQILTAMPIDLMCQLDDYGIDFTTIDDYELFLLLFPGICSQNTNMIFGDLDLKQFKLATNEKNGTIVLYNSKDDIVIDRAIHDKIADILRTIHHLEKDTRKPGNKEAQKYMIDRAKKKLKRERDKVRSSQLEPLIISMVNTEQYKYNFATTRDLSIYQFNESVRQIINKVDYDNRMHGVYAGTVSIKDLSQDDLNWIVHK